MQSYGGRKIQVICPHSNLLTQGTLKALNGRQLKLTFYLCEIYSCACPDGFIGHRCEINEDDCIKHKCENNATCVDLIGHYKCQCQPGFTGIVAYYNSSCSSNKNTKQELE